ncbi:MAG: hypothetical protein LUH15_11535 [Tannerellaceae bacterium]|nr:hypothetical protein [Tannerellaceae bacterium]
MNVRYAETAWQYIDSLTEILYTQHYFSYKESAIKYVISLITEMKATIHIKQKQRAPLYFSRYGKDLWYVSYPKNKRTTWYFFFTYHPDNDTYFIRYITNNHTAGHLL